MDGLGRLTQAQEDWARCRDWIASALPYTGGTHDIEDVARSVSDGSMIFVPGRDMAVVLEVAVYPNFKALNVFAGGGEKRGVAMKEYCDRIDPYLCFLAAELGCKEIRHYCRPGSERIGERLGYRKLCAVMVKDV